MKEFFQSKKIRYFLGFVGGVVVLLLTFQLGVYVGYKKAGWSFRWGENYHRAFGGPKGGFLRDFEGKDFVAGHGTPGEVLSIASSSLVITDPFKNEKIVNVNEKTVFKKGFEIIKISDVKTGEKVVVIGSPGDDGTIQGALIRVFDSSNKLSPQPRFMPPPEKMMGGGFFR